jgi:hypothetical protein
MQVTKAAGEEWRDDDLSGGMIIPGLEGPAMPKTHLFLFGR